jgi:hypothetical protein
MENKKAYEHPKSGVFYVIPDPKKVGHFTIYSETQEEGSDDVVHLFLFDKVKRVLEAKFKVSLSEEAADAYTGIPRGRVIEPSDIHGNWIIAHGNDFPLDTYKSEIVSDFTLGDAVSLGHIRWEVDPHEKMGARDKRTLESELGIEINPTGWKYKK